MSSQKFIKSYKKIHQIIEFFFHSSSESSILEGRVKYFGVFVGERELLSVVAGVRGVFDGECSGDLNIDCLGNAEGTTKVDDGGEDNDGEEVVDDPGAEPPSHRVVSVVERVADSRVPGGHLYIREHYKSERQTIQV